MFRSLRHRVYDQEWMDAPGVDPRTLRRSLRYIRWVNRCLGYTRATLWHLKRFSRHWTPGQTIRMIDLATGSGDIPLAIARWGRRAGFDIHIVGVDLHPRTSREAAALCRDEPRIRIVQADALASPFDAGSFDYALTNMFLHHLGDAEALRLLREMDRLARRGIIAADLLRNRRAYAWITLLTTLSGRMVRHDARVSVLRAFTKAEVLHMRDLAGIGYARFTRHFAHRFVLAGEKT